MSTITSPIVLDSTFKEMMGQTNAMLAAIASDKLPITSWSAIQSIVRSGGSGSYFHAGDQLTCGKDLSLTVSKSSTNINVTVIKETFFAKVGTTPNGSYTFTYNGSKWTYLGESITLSEYGINISGTVTDGDTVTIGVSGTSLIWDILDTNHDEPTDNNRSYTMSLLTHDCVANLQFDAPEAMYYCETLLSAGTYCFTIPNVDADYGGNGTYYFTLTKDIPAAGQIVFDWGWGKQASSSTISTYSSSTSTTPIETVNVASGSRGTSLGTLLYNELISGNINDVYRSRYGSNRWKTSALRQWLNSSNKKGNVWKPQTKFDRPPTWVNTIDGFMSMIDDDFLATVGKTHKVTAQHVCDGTGVDETDDYFFLVSRPEIYAGEEYSGCSEGTPYEYFSGLSDSTAATTGSDTNRIKYLNSSSIWWQLRTPSSWLGSHVRFVRADGSLGSNTARGSNGVSVACNII